jgi:acyl-CoA reductase-like NAD-dependent aldehyde dehydrogenase
MSKHGTNEAMKPHSADSDESVQPFIDGTAVRSETSATFDVINPSNGQRVFAIPVGCEADVNRAVTSARHAFERHWGTSPPSQRKQILHRFADLIASNAEALDALDAQEMGKPIRETTFSAAAAAGLVRFYAEAVDKVLGDVYSSDKDSVVMQRRVPRGVVAAVVPWNFPTFNAALKIAPALAAGNCVVLKPSELSSRSSLRLGTLAAQAGLPGGVLNIVPGIGEIVGRCLGLHPDVDLITFTGSTETGRRMLQYAGQSNLKVVVAECGGKSPHVVFDDGVDVDAVADAVANRIVTNQGQICSVGSRLLVQRSIEQRMIERICARFTSIVMGDALDPRTTFGPIASAKQCARVMDYINGATRDGAQLVVGGRRRLEQTGGYYVEPTLFRNVSSRARIAQEEIFGPVLSVTAFDDEASAIQLANGTVYGLAATVWTTNVATGMRVAKGIRSPVRVNAAIPKGEGAGHAGSYEPSGQSGIGTEGGLAGMETYMRRQLISIYHG